MATLQNQNTKQRVSLIKTQMLRNKIGKPSQTAPNTQPNKKTQTKPNSIQLSNTSGIKVPSGINPAGGFGGIKVPSLIGVKPQVNPTLNKLTATLPQGTIPTVTKKQIAQNQQSQQDKKQQKTHTIHAQQIKTEQQRLAQLVTKKAAQMKKEYQMINKISSQVGSQKKSYVKEYQAKFSHALKAVEKRLPLRNKENQGQNQSIQNKKTFTTQITEPLWRINQWDIEGNIVKYMGNFTTDKYM